MSQHKTHDHDYSLLYILTWLFALISYIVYKVMNGADMKSIEFIVVGIFGMVNLLLGYKWGASSSGARKDATIQSLASTPSVPANVEHIETINVEPKN